MALVNVALCDGTLSGVNSFPKGEPQAHSVNNATASLPALRATHPCGLKTQGCHGEQQGIK